MAEQRQPFRFRLPWSTAPAAPRPNQETQEPSSPQSPARPPQPAAVAQRRPSRSARSGAPPTRLPPARAEPPPASPSSTRSGPSSRTSSSSAPQRPIASPTKELSSPPSRAVSRTQSPSPSRDVGQQAKSIPPVTKPPTAPRSATAELEQESKSLSVKKKTPITTHTGKPQKVHPLSKKPLFMDTKTPQTEEEEEEEEEVETLRGKGELPASEEIESKQESRKEVYETSVKEPLEILKGTDHEELKNMSEIRDTDRDSKTKAEGHSDTLLNTLGQYPREETFDRKEILKTFGSNENNTKSEHLGHEKGSSFKHKKAHLDKELKEDLPKVMHRQGTRQDKHGWNEKPLSIITLAGENTGATMHLNSEPAKRERPIHIHRGYKARPYESVDTVADGEEGSRSRKTANTIVEDETRKTLYVNNNAQGINNSLVFKSSVTERNPGAHVVLSHDAAASAKSGKEVETCDTHKAEVRPAPSETLTYAPRIRRRCLRGLLLESSDSDPENSEKRQHHGCRA
ncbi:hypothetical protein vseg_006802 [Gypsophila vaccaria]